jgi:hypothetical protein
MKQASARRGGFRRAIALGLSLLVLGWSVHATAAPTAKDQAQARFKQGAAYYAEGAYERALTEYEAAYALLPLPEIVFNIGQAQRMRGQRVAAIEAYRLYLESRPEGAPSDLARHYVAVLQREEDEARAKARREATPPEKPVEKPAKSGEARSAVLVGTPPAAPPQRTPVYKRWWLWTIVGVGAVGLGVGLTRPRWGATLHPDLMESALVHP